VGRESKKVKGEDPRSDPHQGYRRNQIVLKGSQQAAEGKIPSDGGTRIKAEKKPSCDEGSLALERRGVEFLREIKRKISTGKISTEFELKRPKPRLFNQKGWLNLGCPRKR